ncbi:MAG: pitrilysin family protein, partial [Acidobacteriota bacterium]
MSNDHSGTMPQISFEKYVLENGLQVILHVDRKLPVVHVNQWYHVGSKNERAGRTGFAHLFEHIMFQGSLNASADYFSYVEKAGANLREGGVNGTTSSDRTNYFATVPSGSLEYLLWVESDRLATLADALTQAKLDGQREVVRNERRQSYENQPYGRWFGLLTENLHPKDHPYSWMVIGSHEDLVAASIDDVTAFFHTYYTPNNLTLVVAGDFDPLKARELIARYYGSIPPGPALERPSRYIPKLTGEKIIDVSDRVPQERIYLAWPSPQYFGDDEADLEIAANILSDGLSSRLNRVLVYDRQISTSVSAFQWSQEISGTFIIVADARPGASLQEIESIITAEVARLASDGPTEAEVSRARTKWEYDYVSGLERIGGFGGKADKLAQYNVFLGDPDRFDQDVDRFRSVSAASVARAVGKWINSRDRLVIRFHPELSQRSSEAGLDRSIQPPLGEDLHFETPAVQSAVLENGMDLFVVSRNDLPKVAVTLVTRAGTISDSPGLEGVANFTASMLELGTGTRRALDIEDALGDLGTTVSGFAAREYAVLTMSVLRRSLETAMTIFSDLVRNPSFPESEVRREKLRHLDMLAQQSNDPSSVAARLRPMLAFGRTHPYGRPATGSPQSVETITRDDLERFHREQWRAGSSALVFAGDITLGKATELANEAFSSWAPGTAPVPDIALPQPARGGQIFVVNRPDAAQTVVSQILPAPARKVADFYALRLVDAVWGGGGFGTR